MAKNEALFEFSPLRLGVFDDFYFESDPILGKLFEDDCLAVIGIDDYYSTCPLCSVVCEFFLWDM